MEEWVLDARIPQRVNRVGRKRVKVVIGNKLAQQCSHKGL